MQVGKWSRVEGTLCDPNPNKPFAKMENLPLFNQDGRLNPSITTLGKFLHFKHNLMVFSSEHRLSKYHPRYEKRMVFSLTYSFLTHD